MVAFHVFSEIIDIFKRVVSFYPRFGIHFHIDFVRISVSFPFAAFDYSFAFPLQKPDYSRLFPELFFFWFGLVVSCFFFTRLSICIRKYFSRALFLKCSSRFILFPTVSGLEYLSSFWAVQVLGTSLWSLFLVDPILVAACRYQLFQIRLPTNNILLPFHHLIEFP